MRIGIPKEIKPMEGRVGLVPEAAGKLVDHGHTVCVQAGAGEASGYVDGDYEAVGARVLKSAVEVYDQTKLIIKVKEPIAPEYDLLRRDHIVFSYLHLAATPELAGVLLDKGLTAVAFETVERDGALPLLAPMSDIAGRLAVQIGSTLLHRPNGGRGLLLGGLPAAERGSVVVLGAGNVGGNAARLAARLGAQVTTFSLERTGMERMRAIGPNVTALYSFPSAVESALRNADLLIGAVLIPGARAPRLVSAEQVARMRPGSVIVDVAVDQGGCVETIRPTDYTNPTYVHEGVIHFGVTNMPAAVPRSASQALSAALIPYALRLAEEGWENDAALARGINVQAGRIVHPAVAASLEAA